MKLEVIGVLRGYPVVLRRLPVGNRVYDLLGPGNFEALLDDPRVASRFARDEYMPYWAEFWPACLILADAVASWPEPLAGAVPTVLELGCGLGLVSLVALARGYRVIASDYEDDALAFVAASAQRNGLPAPILRYVDWRKRYSDLQDVRIVASEVLYEARSIEPMAEFLAVHLPAHGEALICDQNRSVADGFPAAVQARGLRVETTPIERAVGDGRVTRGRLFRVSR